MTTQYKITIEVLHHDIQDWPDWKKVADSGNPKDGGAIYDHVPAQRWHTNTETVYEQVVEELNIWGVIEAVNAGPIPRIAREERHDHSPTT